MNCEFCGENYLDAKHDCKPAARNQTTPLAYIPITVVKYDQTVVANDVRCEGNVFRFNPWTGNPRNQHDISMDPYGLLIVPPGEVMTPAGKAAHCDGFVSSTDIPTHCGKCGWAETHQIHAATRVADFAESIAALPKSELSEGAQALVEMLLDPEQYGYAVTPEVRDHARRVLGIPPVEMPPQPVHLTEATFIAEVPPGAQMIAVGPKILVVAPGMAPCWITPTGLVQVEMTKDVAERRQAEQQAAR